MKYLEGSRWEKFKLILAKNAQPINNILQVCSKSIVFVPQNITLPMLKFPLADCQEIDEWSPKSFQSSLASKKEVMALLQLLYDYVC